MPLSPISKRRSRSILSLPTLTPCSVCAMRMSECAGGFVRRDRHSREHAIGSSKLFVLAPSNPETHQSLAVVLAITGQAKDAIRVARTAIDLNPNFAEAYAVLGRALIFCGDLEGGLAGAIRCQERCRHIRPS